MAEFGTQILRNVPFFGTPFVIVALSGVLDVMDSLVLVDGGDSTPGSLIT